MDITYRALLEAIAVANELDADCKRACMNPARWSKDAFKADEAAAVFNRANKALDQQVKWD